MAIHFRDLLRVTKQGFKETGEVSRFSLCGEHDPEQNRLEFGDPMIVLSTERGRKNACDKCVRIWTSEETNHSQYNKFRKMIHKAVNAGYGRDAINGRKR